MPPLAKQLRPPHNRRNFLKRAGAATLVLVAGGGVYRATDRGVFRAGQGAAYEPWRDWRTNPEQGPLRLVQSAVLAANPHNTQPWLFRVREGQLELFADPERNLGAIDPFLREMYTGLGCALENAMLTAEALGYSPQLELMPDPKNSAHVARLTLLPGQKVPSPLYHAIPERHTNRAAYDTARPVDAGTLGAMSALNRDPSVGLSWLTGDEKRRFGDLTIAATDALIADSEQMESSDAWLRLGWDQTQGYRDGITLDAGGTPLLQRSFLKLLPNTLLSDKTQSAQFFSSTTRNVQVPTASAFGLVTVQSSRDHVARLNGGRLWQRLHLWATTQGLAVQPLNQTTERSDRERQKGLEPTFTEALAELSGPDRQVLMPFRIGYSTRAALESPRRPVQDVLKI